VQAFHDRSLPYEKIYIRHAKTKAGEVEVDSNAIVSVSDDNGAYVMAWLWVADSDIWKGPTDSDGEPCRFVNHYHCEECDQTWSDQWSCACNDECPSCGAEIEPTESTELDLEGSPIDELEVTA
jgi:hypothetical protein